MKKKTNKTKKMNKNDITKPHPAVKSLGDLMKDEDGFVTKETILKVGLSTVAALGVAGVLSDPSLFAFPADAVPDQHLPPSHTNTVTGINGNTEAQHTNVTTHTSY